MMTTHDHFLKFLKFDNYFRSYTKNFLIDFTF